MVSSSGSETCSARTVGAGCCVAGCGAVVGGGGGRIGSPAAVEYGGGAVLGAGPAHDAHAARFEQLFERRRRNFRRRGHGDVDPGGRASETDGAAQQNEIGARLAHDGEIGERVGRARRDVRGEGAECGGGSVRMIAGSPMRLAGLR